jgi:hypothetical protein
MDGLSEWGGAGREPMEPVMLLSLPLLKRVYQLSDA